MTKVECTLAQGMEIIARDFHITLLIHPKEKFDPVLTYATGVRVDKKTGLYQYRENKWSPWIGFPIEHLELLRETQDKYMFYLVNEEVYRRTNHGG